MAIGELEWSGGLSKGWSDRTGFNVCTYMCMHTKWELHLLEHPLKLGPVSLCLHGQTVLLVLHLLLPR